MELPSPQESVDTVLEALGKSYVKGLSLLGGRALPPPEPGGRVLDLVRQVRERFPEKDIWCYTGYLFEDLAAGKVGEHGRALLEQLDMLVDGPFVIALKNLGLRFRGSSNQRIIEVRPSLERGGAGAVGRDLSGIRKIETAVGRLYFCVLAQARRQAQGLGRQEEQGRSGWAGP